MVLPSVKAVESNNERRDQMFYFEPVTSGHYDEYSAELDKLPLEERLSEESRIMQGIQNDPRKYVRYYAVDTAWILNWTKYVQDKTGNSPHPGPLDNTSLLKRIQNQHLVDEWQKN